MELNKKSSTVVGYLTKGEMDILWDNIPGFSWNIPKDIAAIFEKKLAERKEDGISDQLLQELRDIFKQGGKNDDQSGSSPPPKVEPAKVKFLKEEDLARASADNQKSDANGEFLKEYEKKKTQPNAGAKRKKEKNFLPPRKILVYVIILLLIIAGGIIVACKNQQTHQTTLKKEVKALPTIISEKTVPGLPDTKEYWLVERSNTLVISWICIGIAAIAIFMLALYRKRSKNDSEPTHYSSRRKIATAALSLAALALGFLVLQAIFARSRNTYTRTEALLDPDPGRDRWLIDSMIAVCQENPPRDTGLLRKYNESVMKFSYAESRRKIDSAEYAAGNKGRDSAFAKGLLATRDSCISVITGIQKKNEDLQKASLEKDKRIVRLQDDSLRQKSENARLQAENSLEPTVVNPSFRLVFSIIGIIGLIAFVIAFILDWTVREKMKRTMMIIAASCLLLFGLYFWRVFSSGSKFCLQRAVATTDTTQVVKDLKERIEKGKKETEEERKEKKSISELLRQAQDTINTLRRLGALVPNTSVVDSLVVTKTNIDQKQKADTVTTIVTPPKPPKGKGKRGISSGKGKRYISPTPYTRRDYLTPLKNKQQCR